MDFFLLAQGGGGGGGGGGWSQYGPLLGKILIVVLFVGGSVLQWVIKTLREKAKEREAMLAREKARHESLRTGRPDDAPMPVVPSSPVVAAEDAKRRLQEIAARRRAELEAAMRGEASPRPAPVQAQLPRPGAATQSPAQTISRPDAQPMPPAVPRQPSRGQQPRPAKAKKPRPQQPAISSERRSPPLPTRPDRSLEPQRTSAREQAVEDASRAVSQPTEPRRAVPAGQVAEALALGATGAVALQSGGTPADWRRAFIMAELLKPPLSERPLEEHAG